MIRVGTRTGLQPVLAAGLVGLLLVGGWAIGSEHAKLLVLVLALLGLCVLALTQRGALIGILVLAAIDGLPFVDASRLVTSKLAISDIAAIGLALAATIWILLDGGSRPDRTAGRIISRVGVLLAVWFFYVMARTLVDQHVPLLRALYFARDFILFGLLLAVLPRVRLNRRDINLLVGILAVGVCVFAVGQIMTATGVGNPGPLIHFHYTLAESGLTRVYSNTTDLVTAGLALSLGATLLARRRTVRLIALPITILLLVSTIVQLTRARWIGLIVGAVLVSLWLLAGDNARVNVTLRRRLSVAIGLLGLVAIVAIAVAPSLGAGGHVFSRLTSIFSDLQSGSGTVAIREIVTNRMTALLGGHWPFGLGFIPPFSHFYLGLPGGSIRDPDVGVLNAVMTMGVLGALLIYFPVVVALVDCLQHLSRKVTSESDWLYFGGAIWLVATLSSSVTLITLFSTSGLALTAVMITVLTNSAVSSARQVTASADARVHAAPTSLLKQGPLATRA
jgi:hypothetical protein